MEAQKKDERSMHKPKVFGIGFQKTGTSSLGEALEVLGYRVCTMNFPNRLEGDLGEPLSREALKRPDFYEVALNAATGWAERHDGFQDLPWFMFYKEMDAHYAGSKFVLTTRDLDAWVRAMRSYDRTYTKRRAQVVLEWIFGVGEPSRHEDHYKAIHQRHVDDVLAYFRNRPQDLLVLDVAGPRKMRQLSQFLGQRMPRNRWGLPHAYPHRNIGKRNRLINWREDLKTRLRGP